MFDSNRAWQDAVAAAKANREVLLAVGGVFFLLPTLLSTVFLSDFQAALMANAGKQEVVGKLMRDNLGLLLGFGLGGWLVQMIGYGAVAALLSDRGRPTVGQAIGAGLKVLPTLALIFALFLTGTFIATVIVSIPFALLFSAAGMQVLGAVLAVVMALALAVWASVRLSLVLPVAVNEGLLNPLAAMLRSWRLTRRNGGRLFGFFALLTLAYFVIALVATFMVMGPILLLLGQGQGALIAMGLFSGAIGAVASVLLAAVLVQIHRQLAGASPEAASLPFE